MAVRLTKRLFTTREYHRMAEAGVFSESDRLELIAGEVLTMSPIGSRHAACVDRLNALFHRQIGDAAIIRTQNPVVLDEHTELQPDLALLRPRADFYAEAHPEPNAIILVAEVLETSAHYDRQAKLPLYAMAGIPEVWLIDLPAGGVECHRQPAGREFQQINCLGRGEPLSPLGFPSAVLYVEEILG